MLTWRGWSLSISVRIDCSSRRARPPSTRRAVSNRPMRKDARVAAILERIRDIPPGHVQAYSDIDPMAPRLVGRILATTHDDDVPWFRVVRADGTIPKGRRQRE